MAVDHYKVDYSIDDKATWVAAAGHEDEIPGPGKSLEISGLSPGLYQVWQRLTGLTGDTTPVFAAAPLAVNITSGGTTIVESPVATAAVVVTVSDLLVLREELLTSISATTNVTELLGPYEALATDVTAEVTVADIKAMLEEVQTILSAAATATDGMIFTEAAQSAAEIIASVTDTKVEADTTDPTLAGANISVSGLVATGVTVTNPYDAVGITGFMIRGISTKPSVSLTGTDNDGVGVSNCWSTSFTSCTFTVTTAQTISLYVFAKDAAGNVSTGAEVTGVAFTASSFPAAYYDAFSDSSLSSSVAAMTANSGTVTETTSLSLVTTAANRVAAIHWPATAAIPIKLTDSVAWPQPISVSTSSATMGNGAMWITLMQGEGSSVPPSAGYTSLDNFKSHFVAGFRIQNTKGINAVYNNAGAIYAHVTSAWADTTNNDSTYTDTCRFVINWDGTNVLFEIWKDGEASPFRSLSRAKSLIKNAATNTLNFDNLYLCIGDLLSSNYYGSMTVTRMSYDNILDFSNGSTDSAGRVWTVTVQAGGDIASESSSAGLSDTVYNSAGYSAVGVLYDSSTYVDEEEVFYSDSLRVGTASAPAMPSGSTVSFYYKCPSGTTAIYVSSNNGSVVNSVPDLTFDNTWRQATYTYSSNQTAGNFAVFAEGAADGSSVYLDDIRLTIL